MSSVEGFSAPVSYSTDITPQFGAVALHQKAFALSTIEGYSGYGAEQGEEVSPLPLYTRQIGALVRDSFRLFPSIIVHNLH